MTSWAILLVASYLVGAIPFSYLIVRWKLGADVRSLGSGNAGATNVLRTTGVLEGVGTLVLDVFKGALMGGVAEVMGAPAWVVAGSGLAAVLGHVYPVYLGFRGGKGVATAAGALGVLSPFPTMVAFAVFVIVVIPTRFVALASVSAAASYPLALWATDALGWIEARDWVLEATTAIAALVIWKHRGNLRRLLNGTEPRLERGVIDRETPP